MTLLIFCLFEQDEEVDITANSLHPGAIITNLLRYHSFIDGKCSKSILTVVYVLLSVKF